MPPAASIRADGARQLRRELKKAGSDLTDLTAAHRAIAEKVLQEARRTAPVRTGRLRDSLKAKGTQATAILNGGDRRRTGVPYANPIHWGWPKRNIRSNPFVYAAVMAVEDDITTQYLRAVERAVGKISNH